MGTNHGHSEVWTDLLEGVGQVSWPTIIAQLYAKEHGYSNYRYCLKRSHLEVRRDVYNDPKVRRFLEEDAQNERKIESVLDEMCHLLDIQGHPSRKLKYSGAPFIKCINKIYSSIYVNKQIINSDSLLKQNGSSPIDLDAGFKAQYLRLSQDLPIVILPTHRSYMDTFFLTYLNFINELPLPVVATGDNFKGLGSFLTNYLKQTGAFIIRRNARRSKDIEANAYFDVLRAYVHSVILGGENPLEFFMEGTRTRVGQVLRPKTGLLSMVADMYTGKIVEDVYILPVVINYQRTLEEQLYVAENTPQINKQKPKESAKNLLAGLDAIIKRKYGKVYVRFVEPFKLSDHFALWSKDKNLPLDESSHTYEVSDAALHEFTDSLASRVCLAQAYNNVLMPIHLMAFSIMNLVFFSNDNKFAIDSESESYSVPIALVADDFYKLEQILKALHPGAFLPGWKTHLDMLDELVLDRDKILTASSDRRCVNLRRDALTFHTLQYYGNQVFQMLLPLAITSIVDKIIDDPQSSVIDVRSKIYEHTRYLLSKEFLMDELHVQQELYQTCLVLQSKAELGTESMITKHLLYFVRSHIEFLSYIEDKDSFRQGDYFEHLFDEQAHSSNASSTYISKDMLKNMILLAKEQGICNVPDPSGLCISNRATGSRDSSSNDAIEIVGKTKLKETLSWFETIEKYALTLIKH